MFEREPDGGTVGLKAAARGSRFSQRAGDLVAVAVENKKVWSERVLRVELANAGYLRVVVAGARKSRPGFEYQHAEVVLAADKGDVGGKIKPFREHFHLVAVRHHDILGVSRIEEHGFHRANRVGRIGQRRDRSDGDPRKEQRSGKRILSSSAGRTPRGAAVGQVG